MISQKWFSKGDTHLMGITYCPEQINAAVLILPGFGMHMCDVDYFMSKLARKLYQSQVYVLLLEPYGHGDSYGELGECTIASLIEDIKIGIDHCKSISNNVYAFARGLIANLLTYLDDDIKLVGLSPVLIQNNHYKDMNIPEGITEISNFVKGYDYVQYSDFDKELLCLIEMIGGRIRHVHGQFINSDILHYIVENDHLSLLVKRKNSYWIFYEKDAPKNYNVFRNDELMHRDCISYYKTAVYRDALWQSQVINQIMKIINL